MDSPFLTLEQAAARAQVSKKTVTRWLKLGLPHVRLNSRLKRIRTDVFDAWLANWQDRKVQGPPSRKVGNVQDKPTSETVECLEVYR